MQKILLLLLVLFSLLPNSASAQQKIKITGTITSVEDKLPVIGVLVKVEGTQNATLSDVNGQYSISATVGQNISFSYVGMKEAVVKVEPTTTVVNVAMKVEPQSIENVVVMAYGTRKKNTVAGSVASIKGSSITDTPAASFDQALQGKATGLSVMSNTGEPSAPASFQIRGVNSINSGTSPLFILDGIAISSNDFSALNPSDIENVSVLKDAASTSIYGARAANGVVVITSRRGKSGTRGRITASTQQGFSNLAYGKWDIMNTAQRIEYEKQIGLDAGKNYDELSKVDVDWRKAVYNQSAPLSSYNVTFSGATDAINYYVSGNYYRQQGVAKGSDFRATRFRTNLEATVAPWIKLGTNIALAYEQIQEADEGQYTTVTPISASRFMLPYWSPYAKDGSVASISDGSWLGTNQNPLEWLANNPMSTNRLKAIASMYVDMSIFKGFNLKSTVGVDVTDAKSISRSNPSYETNFGQGMVGRSNSTAYNLTWTNLATYNTQLGENSLNFMLGHEMVSNQSEGFNVIGRGQNNDKLLNLTNATSVSGWGDFISQSTFMSVFARGEYNYGQRYFVEASVREDGSSKFGKNRKWATFWAVGLMWNAKRESFLNDVNWLTTAQISGSVGTSGNSSIPPYDHLALVGGGKLYNGVSGMAPVSMGNEDLTWEKLRTINVGLKLGFWNRLNVNLELYDKLTSDMLMAVPVSFTTGYKTQWDNIGKMINRGVELEISGTVIQTPTWSWSVSANASYNFNKITELYGGRDEYEMADANMLLKVGNSYGDFFINRFAGVNPANGDALWLDKNGKTTTEYRAEDRVLVGKSWNAPWQGGFGTELSWKGLSLSAQFSWVLDRYMMNNDRWFDESNGMFSSNNQSAKLLDRWQNVGDITDIPRHGVSPQMDSRFLENASFLRLKNLMLSYRLPKICTSWSKDVLTGIRVYAQAQNLFTWTSFTGMDPESNMNIYQASYPMSKQFTFGLELTF